MDDDLSHHTIYLRPVDVDAMPCHLFSSLLDPTCLSTQSIPGSSQFGSCTIIMVACARRPTLSHNIVLVLVGFIPSFGFFSVEGRGVTSGRPNAMLLFAEDLGGHSCAAELRALRIAQDGF
jgi:hypothetical protein